MAASQPPADPPEGITMPPLVTHTGMRTCQVCKRELAVSEFYRMDWRCKSCRDRFEATMRDPQKRR